MKATRGASKGARKMGFKDAEDRLGKDRSYAWLNVSKVASTYSAAFVALAARMARGADAVARGFKLYDTRVVSKEIPN